MKTLAILKILCVFFLGIFISLSSPVSSQESSEENTAQNYQQSVNDIDYENETEYVPSGAHAQEEIVEPEQTPNVLTDEDIDESASSEEF